jgi:hypothetical protein
MWKLPNTLLLWRHSYFGKECTVKNVRERFRGFVVMCFFVERQSIRRLRNVAVHVTFVALHVILFDESVVVKCQ